MTRTVNFPWSRTMDASQSSNSVGLEIDKGNLGNVLVEKHVEGFAVGILEPRLERLELCMDGGGRAGLGATGALPHDQPHWLQPVEDRSVRSALACPAKLLSDGMALRGKRGVLQFRTDRGVGERAHQPGPPERERASAREPCDLLCHLLARGLLGLLGRLGGGFETGDQFGCNRCHRDTSGLDGGGGWESNPPKTV